MTTIITIIEAASVLVGSVACCVISFHRGHKAGRKLGSDEQRTADIIELWAKMPKRDSRGRYAAKS